jgi:hypothetical protein
MIEEDFGTDYGETKIGYIKNTLDCAQIVPVKVKYFLMVPNETKS